MNTRLFVESFICYEDSARDGHVIFKVSHVFDLHKLFSIFRSTLYLSFSVSLISFSFSVWRLRNTDVFGRCGFGKCQFITEILLVGERCLQKLEDNFLRYSKE